MKSQISDCFHPFAIHGGNVNAIARQYDIAPEELLDFSANINPAGPPSGVIARLQREAANPGLLMRYPDIELDELMACLSSHTRVERAAIVVANGAAALIDAAVRAVNDDEQEQRLCLLPTPAFSEYRRVLDANGYQTMPFALEAARDFKLDTAQFIKTMLGVRPRLVIIINPHNPSGALVPPLELQEIVHAAQRTRTVALLDEAFIDYAPEASLVHAATQAENLIVLRSLTKFYGMPALRVGYAVASVDLAVRMSRQVPSWPVTTLAANAVIEALNDTDYAQHTREANARERERLCDALTRLGMRVFPSAANFLLIELPGGMLSARSLRKRLIVQHHIIVRDCSTYEGLERQSFVRVAVRAPADNERLIEALRETVLVQGKEK